MKLTGFVAVALATALTMACNREAREADNAHTDPAVGTAGEGVPPGLQRFVHDVTMANAAEIELGKMASEKGQSAQVKDFGQTMVHDHMMAGDELEQAIAPYHIDTASQMDAQHRELAERLRSKQGMDFDHEYMTAMVSGHESVKDMLLGRAKEANTEAGKPNNQPASETAVNAWAAKTLPAVEHHLDMAKQIREKLDKSRRTATD
jgi:putative membrane protein